MAKRETAEKDEVPDPTWPRLMYRGPEDDTAETKLINDEDEAEEGDWRLRRRTDATEKTKESATSRERTTQDSGFNPHSANVEQVITHVASVYDRAELKRLRTAEEKNPSFDGGRVGVIQAIEERDAELKTAGKSTPKDKD